MTTAQPSKKESVLERMHYIGKALFVILVMLQAILLARYPSIYFENEWGNTMMLLMFPTLIVLCWHEKKKKNEQPTEKFWRVWLVYVITLMIMIGVIFGGLRSRLDKTHFFGPNNLKMIMCLTPAIALLLFITTSNARKLYSELVVELCGNLAVDLFDSIEILAALLPESASTLLPDGFAGTTIAFVSLSLLLSVLEISENKLEKTEGGEIKFKKIDKLYFWRLILKIPVNFSLLIIRLVVWLKYKHDASIFIAKNMIIILLMIYNIVLYVLDSKEEKEKEETRTNSAASNFAKKRAWGILP